MLDLSPEKILVLAVLALVVLGPNRLPQAARTLGRLLGQLRTMTAGVQQEVREVLHEPAEAFGVAIDDFRPSGVRRSLRRGVMDTITPPATTSPPARPAGAPGASPYAGHPDDPAFN